MRRAHYMTLHNADLPLPLTAATIAPNGYRREYPPEHMDRKDRVLPRSTPIELQQRDGNYGRVAATLQALARGVAVTYSQIQR